MAEIVVHKPAYRITVGKAYFADYNAVADTFSSDVVAVESIKEIGIALEKSSSTIYASGITYDTTNQKTGEAISIDAVQLPIDLVSKYLGESSTSQSADKGLTYVKVNDKSPDFAFGYSVEYSDGKKLFKWYPRCKLITADETVATRDESAADPSASYEVIAMPKDKVISFKYDQSLVDPLYVPHDEAKFFSSVVYKATDTTLIGTEELVSAG
ncbi:MAG TPA: major tail protein [Bacillota bacterium]|nr:major tail protein [Bacillota bacterium]